MNLEKDNKVGGKTYLINGVIVLQYGIPFGVFTYSI